MVPTGTDSRRAVDVTPSARRLTESLRDIGYDFAAALADLVDNSIAANASEVTIDIVFDGDRSYVAVADDGDGMTEAQLTEALRFGTRREYEFGDLGRYGLGLKTASISQCRHLTVVTRRAASYRRIVMKTLDVDHIGATDRWEVIDPPDWSAVHDCTRWLDEGPGTVVVWENLDRVLPDRRPDGGWARRRVEQLARKAGDYLAIVFHRFLEGGADGTNLTITVNGEKAAPWNPFAPLEEHREVLPAQSFEISVGKAVGQVTLRRYVLPPRHMFSTAAEFERLSGPLKWNRQQGLYIYRSRRLVQSGGWSGIRAADEHTKFARASLDFRTDLDSTFRINVAKMRVLIPAEIRTLLERPIHELCHRADAVYRREVEAKSHRPGRSAATASASRAPDSSDVGSALLVAALEAGEHDAFRRVMDRLRASSPAVADALGW